MNILAIDLGKFKSVACLYRGEQDIEFRTIETRPQEIHDLLVELAPTRLVIEILAELHEMAREVQAATPTSSGVDSCRQNLHCSRSSRLRFERSRRRWTNWPPRTLVRIACGASPVSGRT